MPVACVLQVKGNLDPALTHGNDEFDELQRMSSERSMDDWPAKGQVEDSVWKLWARYMRDAVSSISVQ